MGDKKGVAHLSKQISTIYDVLIEMRQHINELREFKAMFEVRMCAEHQKIEDAKNGNT